MKKNIKQFVALFLMLITVLSFTGCGDSNNNNAPHLEFIDTTVAYQESLTPQTTESNSVSNESVQKFSVSDIPEFSGTPYYVVNGNNPYFTNEEKSNTNAFEKYLPLDNLNRCQVAYANICKELMPTENRESISSVYPSGWKLNGKSNNNEYTTDLVDGGRIYNRCHLIGFQLAGENANEKNLITGTRYMNVTGMLPFENMIADYVKETNNHVLLRVSPLYKNNDLVAKGVLIEAWSVEDNGDGICFNVFCYNVQPGIEINYTTGENSLSNEDISIKETVNNENNQKYILNINSKKFHYPDCSSVKKISDKNKKEYKGLKKDLLSQGYEPCGVCTP